MKERKRTEIFYEYNDNIFNKIATTRPTEAFHSVKMK